ncbi:uncharacterized protein DSM5745_02210 [Aspergillus mulundensis]|uniref:Uncharacterized protein n=1 Tax=Aspergillus mulundensis TaxID=1810919 RepID=A0A3D8SVW0_9EURO|nr:Uncharacterized protein DSM5745_02210 [Aspergillus mulundensis]RDW90435.1 Uncharacterized protein DSM5745_02210 [Aspergillus mulundensis]
MHLTSTLTTLSLALLSLASTTTAKIPQSAYRMPQRERTADPTNPALTWHVSHFALGCSPGGCVYSFNILGHASQNTPGFNTTCNGTSTQDDYAPCKDAGILAQIEPATYPNWTVSVEHQWREGMFEEFYAFGEKNVSVASNSTGTFTIPVGSVYGVA